MPAAINYKSKYMELRSKYIADLDMAFRLGVEQGAQQAQQQQAMEAKAQADQAAQLESQGLSGEQPGQEEAPQQPGQEAPQEGQVPAQDQNGSELDQHISKLEGMLGSNPEPEIQKSLQAIVSLRKAQKDAIDFKKSELAIKGIAKALHKPAFKIGVQASHNMSDNAKKAVSLQHKIVNDIMKTWGEEENKASNDIKSILDVEGLIKE